MRTRLSVFVMWAFVVSCGTSEEADPNPASTAAVEEEVAPPAPEPPPAPVEVADCPEDAWSVAVNGPNRATQSGVEAAGWARSMGSRFERLRACRSIDGFEHLLSCAPVPRGAECSISLPTERCSATLPAPVIPVVVGQWVDTHALPAEGSWDCTRR